MSIFILEFHQHACTSLLRNRVAQAVHELWGKSRSLMTNGRCYDVESFNDALRHELDEILTCVVFDGKSILTKAFDDLENTTVKLSKSIPVDARVQIMSVALIKKQVNNLHRSLSEFVCKFGGRKLEEVLSISVQQFKTKKEEETSSPPFSLENAIETPTTSPLVMTERLESALKKLFTYVNFPKTENAFIERFLEPPCRYNISETELCSDRCFNSLRWESYTMETTIHLAELIDATFELYFINNESRDLGYMIRNVIICCNFILQEFLSAAIKSSKERLYRMDIEVSKMFLSCIAQLLIFDECLDGNVSESIFLPSDIFIEYYRRNEAVLSRYSRALVICLKPSFEAYLRSAKGFGERLKSFRSRLVAFLKRLLLLHEFGREFLSDHTSTKSFPCHDLLLKYRKRIPTEFFTILSEISEGGSDYVGTLL